MHSQDKGWQNSYSGPSNQPLLYWRWRQNFAVKRRSKYQRCGCTSSHPIRTDFCLTRRDTERVITGDRLTKRQDIRSVRASRATEQFLVTSAREWQQCSHPAPPQCCRSACSCTRLLVAYWGTLWLCLAKTEREIVGDPATPGQREPSTRTALVFQETVWRYDKKLHAGCCCNK